MRKEDVFSVVLKLYSIVLMSSLLFKNLTIKIFILFADEIAKNSEVLLTPFNLGIVLHGIMLFLSIYIWYRANKILQVESLIDFKSGAYIFLGLYWFTVGISSMNSFIVEIYFTHQNKFTDSFVSDLFFEGLGIFMVGGAILGYWFWKISELKKLD